MCAPQPRLILVRMDETSVSIRLDLHVACDSLRGAVVDAAGRRAEFLGRVGLLAAIEEVVRTVIPTPESGSAPEHDDDLSRRTT